MKTSLLTLCAFSALFLSILPSGLHAQCGIQAALSCNQGGVASPNISAANSGTNANWVIYDYVWDINGQLFTNGVPDLFPSSAYFLPYGFNEVCVTVYGTNTVTGDSCSEKICNVFQSTGLEYYLELDVSSNGMDASASGYYFGGTPLTAPQINLDWGDGTFSNQLTDVHTYAAAGEYVVCLNLLDPFTFISATTCRKVEVNNGGTTMNVGHLSSNFSGCYPISIGSLASTPPYTSAYYSLAGPATYVAPTSLAYLSPITFASGPYEVVPGQAMAVVSISDINPSIYDINRVAPVYFDVCGVVPDTLRGYVFDDQDADGIRDPAEPGIPNQPVGIKAFNYGDYNYPVLTDSNGYFEMLAPNTSYQLGLAGPVSLNSITVPGSLPYTVNGTGTSSIPLFYFGIAALNCNISGTTYLDKNHDSTYTFGQDVTVQSVTIRAENTITGLVYYTSSGSNGNYAFQLPSGTYKLTPEAILLDSATVYPDTITVNASNGTYSGNNFGWYSPVAGNFGIRVFGHDEARPGFDYQSQLELTNSGFDTLQGVLVFNFDPLLTASTAYPSGGVIDNTSHTVTWATGPVGGAQRRYYNVSYTIPVATPLGTVLSFNASITTDPGYTDVELSNNSDSWLETVIGSFDPNDKKVDPAGQGGAGNVLHGDRLHYRIRFQNTGTASAIHVFVQDEIDTDLDMNTFLMERASHPYTLVIHDHEITWKFLNINLPDSSSDEPGSHGFIEYSIKPVPGLSDGTQVDNTANIYFDFNAPVATNTTTNTLQTTLVGVDDSEEPVKLQAYPNPVRDFLAVEAEGKFQGPVNLTLLDVAGAVVRETNSEAARGSRLALVDVRDLAPGVYIIRVSGSKWNSRIRFVKM